MRAPRRARRASRAWIGIPGKRLPGHTGSLTGEPYNRDAVVPRPRRRPPARGEQTELLEPAQGLVQRPRGPSAPVTHSAPASSRRGRIHGSWRPETVTKRHDRGSRSRAAKGSRACAAASRARIGRYLLIVNRHSPVAPRARARRRGRRRSRRRAARAVRCPEGPAHSAPRRARSCSPASSPGRVNANTRRPSWRATWQTMCAAAPKP